MAAENGRVNIMIEIDNTASMRPRRMAAENFHLLLLLPLWLPLASMRPRRMAAENARLAVAGGRERARFNEAAANGRGKPNTLRQEDRDPPASMRPRRMAAENSNGPRSHAPGCKLLQ